MAFRGPCDVVAVTPPLLLALDPSLACTGGVFVSLDGRRELVEAFTVQTFGDETSYAIEAQHAREPPRARPVPRHREGARGATSRASRTRCRWGPERRRRLVVRARVAVHADRARRGLPTCARSRSHRPSTRLRATGRGQWPKGEGKRRVQNGGVQRQGPMAWDRVLASIVDEKRREAVYDAGAVAMAALAHQRRGS